MMKGGSLMLRMIGVMAALAVGATGVLAQNAPSIAVRKDAMKALGKAWKGPSDMAKGDAPFDLATVKASLKTIEEGAARAKGLFGDDTKVGETDALPAAFENKADLIARFDKLAADAKVASDTIKDEASFKAEWTKVPANCGSCHKLYRRPKS
jgi:cytochrome c556